MLPCFCSAFHFCVVLHPCIHTREAARFTYTCITDTFTIFRPALPSHVLTHMTAICTRTLTTAITVVCIIILCTCQSYFDAVVMHLMSFMAFPSRLHYRGNFDRTIKKPKHSHSNRLLFCNGTYSLLLQCAITLLCMLFICNFCLFFYCVRFVRTRLFF